MGLNFTNGNGVEVYLYSRIDFDLINVKTGDIEDSTHEAQENAKYSFSLDEVTFENASTIKNFRGPYALNVSCGGGNNPQGNCIKVEEDRIDSSNNSRRINHSSMVFFSKSDRLKFERYVEELVDINKRLSQL